MMKQSSVLLVVFILTTLFCGGFIANDIIHNNRLNGFNGHNNSTNWNWEDNWNHSRPTQPVQPTQPQTQPVRPQPQQEQPTRPQSQIVASSYQDAVAKSSQYGMPILAYFEADWCSWCQKMKRETLSASEVQQVMKNYILVHVNADNDKQVVRQFGISGLPGYVITNSRSINLKSGKGYKDASGFARWLNEPSMFEQPKGDSQVEPEQVRPRRS